MCRELSKPLLRASSPLSTLAGAGAEERRSFPLKLWTFIHNQALCAFVLVCFNTSQLLNVSYLYKAMLQAVRASCFTALHIASQVSWRRAVHFKAMLHALQGLASCFKALLHAAMCASRHYFALTKAMLHASCSSRRCFARFKTLHRNHQGCASCFMLFKTLLHASCLALSILQASSHHH